MPRELYLVVPREYEVALRVGGGKRLPTTVSLGAPPVIGDVITLERGVTATVERLTGTVTDPVIVAQEISKGRRAE